MARPRVGGWYRVAGGLGSRVVSGRGWSRVRDNETVLIRAGRAAELPVLQRIDVATGQMFRDIGMPEVADYNPWPLPELEHSRAAGLFWRVAGSTAEPPPFLMGSAGESCLHV